MKVLSKDFLRRELKKGRLPVPVRGLKVDHFYVVGFRIPDRHG